jgi:acetyl-CoA carboxylase carboxyl transferase subunit beta
VETCTFEEMDAEMISVDALGFTGAASYKDKLASNWKKTNLKDAVVTGIGMIGKHRVGLGVMDFSFPRRLDGLGGRRKAHAPDRSRHRSRNLPVIIISTSGGARMYEGMFSLMQMAKTCGPSAITPRRSCPTSAFSRIPITPASWRVTRAWAI